MEEKRNTKKTKEKMKKGYPYKRKNLREDSQQRLHKSDDASESTKQGVDVARVSEENPSLDVNSHTKHPPTADTFKEEVNEWDS